MAETTDIEQVVRTAEAVGDKIADGDCGGLQGLCHGTSFSMGLRGSRGSSRNQSPGPGIKGTKGPLSLLKVSGPVSFEGGSSAPPYQSRAIMTVSTRMVVSGFSGVSAPKRKSELAS